MFGQNNSPFGSAGGGFGQPTNTAPSAFGAPAPTQGGGLFGSSQPGGVFGAPQQPGQPAAPGGLFGSASSTGQPGAFGAPAAPGAPGGTAFGAPTFGAQAPAAPGLFGSNPSQPPAFGAPAAGQPGGLFGASTTNTTPFGGTQPTTFGQQTSTFGAFGAPAPAPGATTGAFGAPAPAAGGGFFGAPAPAPFGAPQAPTFGAPAPAGGVFGSTTNTGPAFGAAPAPTGLFGSTAPATGGGGLFGSTQPLGGIGGGGTGGTMVAQYTPTNRQDGTSNISLQAITAMPTYEKKSFEELRLEDYTQGNRGNTAASGGSAFGFGGAAPAPSGGLFGASAPAPFGAPTTFGAPAPAPFGSAPAFGAPAPAPAFGATTSPFGGTAPAPAPSGGLFGAAPAPAFGSTAFGATPAPAGGGLFGSAPAPAPFGGTTPAPAPFVGFGASAPATAGFGATTPTTTGGGLFGRPAAAPFGAPATSGGLFASTAPPTFGATSAPGGLFGSTPAPAPFGAAAPTGGGLFGSAPAAGGFGGFGTRPPGTSLFPTPAPAQGGFSFGGVPTPAPPAPFAFSGVPAPAPSLFGASLSGVAQQPQAAAAPLFGAAMPQGLLPPYGAASVALSTQSEVLAIQYNTMMSMKKEMEEMGAWRGNVSSPSSVSTTPQSLPEASVLPRSTRVPFSGSFTPRSANRIRPRGFPKAEPIRKSPNSGVGDSTRARRRGHDNTGFLSPEAYRNSALKLHVNPDSHGKPRLRLRLSPEDSRTSNVPPAEIRDEAAVETVANPPNDDGVVASPENSRQHGLAAEEASSKTKSPPSAASPSRVSATVQNTHPGYLSYQQAIGSSVDDSQPARLDTTTVADASMVPTLTMEGYETVPPMDELSSLSEADLAAVAGFAVRRPGYGMVEWEGAVDVRGISLDDILCIEHRDVQVYMKQEEEGRKPAVGTQLNSPAKVTFYNVFPKRGQNASPEEKAKFEKKVRDSCRRFGAEFISYDIESGVWEFRVAHFSRYALDDEESEDEISPEELQTPRRRKYLPFEAGQIAFEDVDWSGVPEIGHNARVNARVEVQAEEVAREIAARMEKRTPRRVEMEPAWEQPQLVDEVIVEEEVQYVIPPRPTRPSNESLAKAASGFSICQLLSTKAGVSSSTVDFGMRMGRSFRVGWLPNGSFITCSHGTAYGFPQFVVRRPLLSDASGKVSSSRLLQIQHASSVARRSEDVQQRLFSLPSPNEGIDLICAAVNQFSLAVKEEEIVDTLKLLSYLLVNRDVYASEDNKDDCQIASLKKALAESCKREAEVEITDSLRRDDPMSAILAAVSSGDVPKACEIAAEGGYWHLSLVLATSVEGKHDVAQHLGSFGNESDDPVHRSCWHILQDLCGKRNIEDDEQEINVDWRRQLSLRLLGDSQHSAKDILLQYEMDVRRGVAPFPRPKYAPLGGDEHLFQSLMYKVISACIASKEIRLVDVVDPTGFTPAGHDFSMAFHLACIIPAVANVGVLSLSPYEAEYIQDGYETQLVNDGKWEWAVFVALSLIGNNDTMVSRNWKQKRAKDLILRHFHHPTTNVVDWEQKRAFLEQQVGVPPQWFEEALAFRAAYVGDIPRCVHHMVALDRVAGFTIFDRLYLPYIFFRSEKNNNDDENDNNDGLSNDKQLIVEAASSKLSVATEFAELFQLDRRVTDIATRNNVGGGRGGEEELSALSHILSMTQKKLMNRLLSHQKQNIHFHGEYFPNNLSNKIPLSSALIEVSQRIHVLQDQLNAVVAMMEK